MKENKVKKCTIPAAVDVDRYTLVCFDKTSSILLKVYCKN